MSENAKEATKREPVIGILALQGDYDAHRKTLEEGLGAATRFVRTRDELHGVDALILPGGESTTIGKLMGRVGLDDAVRERAQAGMPLFGTCAGMILLAKTIAHRPDQPSLGLMDIRVARNAFGRQVDSFEADIPFLTDGSAGIAEDAPPVRGVFIRAPYVEEAAPDVQILGRFRDRIVGVQQGSILATAFHPELTSDARVHAHFLRMVRQRLAEGSREK